MDTVDSDIISTLAVVDEMPLAKIISRDDDPALADSVRRLIAEVGRPLTNVALAFQNAMR